MAKRKGPRDPEYIDKFARAVYGDQAELSMASFDEEKILTDATLLIGELRAALARANK